MQGKPLGEMSIYSNGERTKYSADINQRITELKYVYLLKATQHFFSLTEASDWLS